MHLRRHRSAAARAVALTITCLALGLAGCLTTTDAWLNKHGKALNRIQSTVDAYGTITLSAPLLARPDEKFAFELNRTAQQYYDEAKNSLQGSASAFEQTVQSFGANISAQVDPIQAFNYAEALRHALAQRNVATQRDEMAASAARDRFEADILLAAQIEDPAQRLQKIAEARSAYAAAIPNLGEGAALPDVNAAAGANVPAAANLPTNTLDPSSILPNQKMLGMLGLRTAPAATLTSRAAVITAAGDRAIQSLFNILTAKSDDTKTVTRTQIFIGLTMVSVNPGWKTREGFAGEIIMQCSISQRIAHEKTLQLFLGRKDIHPGIRRAIAEDMGCLHQTWIPQEVKDASPVRDKPQLPSSVALVVEDREGYEKDYARATIEGNDFPEGEKQIVTPVVAISPMSDAQSLDLAASRRHRTEFAFGLALALRSAGQEAQANAMERWARQVENDSQTRTADVTVNAFSSGSTFGYRILPAFRAITNLGEKRAKSGYRLENQAFPAVISFGIEKNNLRLVVFYNPSTRSFALTEPALQLVGVPHWRPLDRSWFAAERESFVERAEGARAIAAAFGDLQKGKESLAAGASAPSAILENYRLGNLMRYRLEDLRNSYNGSFSTQVLPADALAAAYEPASPPKPVRVQRVLPESVTLEVGADGTPQAKDIEAIVLGENLNTVELSALRVFGGNASIHEATKPVLDGVALKIPLRVTSAANSVVLIISNAQNTDVAVLPVKLKAASPPVVVKIEKKTDKDYSTRTVEIPAGASGPSLEAVRQLLEVTEPKPAAAQPARRNDKG